MEVAAFSDIAALRAADFPGEPDVLLIREELAGAVSDDFPASRVLKLCDEREPAGEERIFRFQSRDALMGEILKQLPGIPLSHAPPSLPEGSGTELCGVWSPVGRCGKTFFAVTMGEILSERNRTLYINLEDHPALSVLGEGRWQTDLSDLIYQYRLDPGRVTALLEGSVRRFDRLEYIPPPLSPGDLAGITGEEWTGFLSLLMEAGIYRDIILDLGSRSGSVPDIVKLCSRLYVPVLDDPVSAAKLEHFKEMLRTGPWQGTEEKISYVHVPELPPGSLPLTGAQLSRGRTGSFIRRRMSGGRLIAEREW